MRIVDFTIPKVFGIYEHGRDGWTQDGKNSRIEYCGECGHQWGSLWKWKDGFNGGNWETTLRHCPKCGTMHDITYGNDECFVDGKVPAPISMRFVVNEFKEHVVLVVTGKELIPGKIGKYWTVRNYKETFSFDAKKRKTIFARWIGEYGSRLNKIFEYELGNPLDRRLFEHGSTVQFLCAHTSIRPYQSKIKNVIHELRTIITKKLEKCVGHKIKSMYTSSGSTFGPLLLPMFNIAYRMIAIDLPNLPKEWKDRDDLYYGESRGSIDHIAVLFYKEQFDIKKMREAKDSVTGLLKIDGLPDKRVFRKTLQNDPFKVILLSKLYAIFQDVDNTNSALEYIKTWHDNGYGSYGVDVARYLGTISGLKDIYSVKTVLSAMKATDGDKGWKMRDTFNMYGNLGDESLQELKRNPVRLRDLHDWMVERIERERHPICRFDNEDPVRRRLAMQLERINFFIPNHSDDLVYAGEKLHNCVGSYIKRVKDGDVHIVLMTDDFGKLIACIEVSQGKIVQAKLSRNVPAAKDAKINAEIIEWAEKAGVEWKSCRDVREIRLPVLISA